MSRTHQTGGEPSQRMLRVAELIRHALSELLSRGDVTDPLLAGKVITVPVVKMSPDLKLATAYIMPLGGKDIEIVLQALERNKKFLRTEVAHRINMKFAPELRFRADTSFDYSDSVDALLRSPKVVRDLVRGENEDEDDA
jgi:ribosome-binding factor A